MAELVGLAEELCDAHQHSEVVEEWVNRNRKRRTVVTVQQGLLAQLREVSVEGLRVSDPMPGGGKPKSKPPGVFEALQRHVYIAVTAAQWCQSMGLPQRMTPEENIRAIVGKAPNLDDDGLGRLLREVRQWRRQAALATGWDSQPYSPMVRCPNPRCARWSSIRIYATEPWSAYCTNPDRGPDNELVCGMLWSGDEVRELAAYVRQTAA